MSNEDTGNDFVFDEKDLSAFKKWLANFLMPCSKCTYTYKVPEETINSVELSNDPNKPFRFVVHEIYECANPDCRARFSYPDSAFVKTFLLKYKKLP